MFLSGPPAIVVPIVVVVLAVVIAAVGYLLDRTA
jgi:hypothetical protein